MSPRHDSKLHGQTTPAIKLLTAHASMGAASDQSEGAYHDDQPAAILRPGWSAQAFSASGTPAANCEPTARKPFPDRRPQRPVPVSQPSDQVLEEWATLLGLGPVLGPLIPTQADRIAVLQLLYQYKHLNGEDFTNLPCTDLITHRVCITPGTRPASARFQKRWPPHTEWWMRKLVQDGLLGGVYELTEPANGRLSHWNARAVMVDKSDDPKPEDEPRMTFDYSRVHEDLPGTYVELSSKVHDHLSNPNHGCLFMADLKHAYLTVPLHPDDRQYFAFTISGIGQCQPTRMQPGSKSAGFTMTAAVYKGFGFIPPPHPEPSLLHSDDPNTPPPLSFYTDDFFGGFKDFQSQFSFLRDHFFPRVEWARMVLSFKKLRLFAESIEALGVKHCIGGHVYIRNGRIAKIAIYPQPSDQSGVRAFLGSVGITRRWVKNFTELAKPLNRLTGKVEWRWTEQEQLSFEIMRIKCSVATSIHGLDLSVTIHFYTDASLNGAGLCITQFRVPAEAFCNGTQLIEVPIAYDSFAFSATQKLYPTYKKELCAVVKFCVKYDYMCKHPYNTTVVHTDHRPLVHFMKSDCHEGFYGHWVDQLRRLNIVIQYIPGPRNKVADGLSRTLFHTDMKDACVEACSRRLSEQGPQWIWKDGKDGFEAFLKGLDGVTRDEVLEEGTAHGVSVFKVQAMASQAGEWASAYMTSDWFKDLYQIHTIDDVDPATVAPRSATKALDYRVDMSTGVLWKHHRNTWLPCIPESRVLSVLRLVHDQAGHWGKAGTLAKLRGYAYWPDQSQDVERYLAGCLECAKHGPATRSQLLHPVIVLGPFRLLGIDFIGPLPCSRLGNFYILHLICYFSRFSITSASKTANATDVVPALQKAFAAYAKPKAVYWDRGHHYDNQLVKGFLNEQNVAFSFSPSGSSQSTGMVEVGNKILEDVIRKGGDWEDNLQSSTRSTNSRTIGHLGMAPCEILLGVPPSPDLSELWQPSAPNDSVRSYVATLSDPTEHGRLVQQYLSYRSELHDRVAQMSIARKEQEAMKYNKGVRPAVFSAGDLVMLHQKTSGKLQPRWRGPFRIDSFATDRQLSYIIRQLNGRLIRGSFHGNHLKRFTPRTGYLAGPSDPVLPQHQTIRKRPRRARLFLRPPKPPASAFANPVDGNMWDDPLSRSSEPNPQRPPCV